MRRGWASPLPTRAEVTKMRSLRHIDAPEVTILAALRR